MVPSYTVPVATISAVKVVMINEVTRYLKHQAKYFCLLVDSRADRTSEVDRD